MSRHDAPAGPRVDEVPDDARALLDQNPAPRADKDAALDLAYDEYCRRAAAGAAPELNAFCARFPTIESSLRRAIQLFDWLEANPSFLGESSAPAPREAVPWPVEGEVFLGFMLLRELGRGSFARVFLAGEPDLGDRLVAVKVSPHGGHEAQTLGRLDHPNVVKVHAVRKDERSGLTAVCMPYLGAATLENVLAAGAAGRPRAARVILDAARPAPGPVAPGDGPSPHPLLQTGTYVEGVCLLGAQLADALAFLHRRKIYHRDLKPSNVLLCPDGRPMLLDFNLSADPHADRDRLGGTLGYMAPEQLLATFGADPAAAGPVDGRSDLYALGVMLFELLAGRHPFGNVPRGKPSREDCAALLARQEQGAPPIRGLCPETSRALARVIDRCLAFPRERRPRDAAEVAVILRRELAPPRRAVRRLLRHPRKLAVAAALALVVGSAGAAYVATRPSLQDQADAARARGDVKAALELSDRALARNPDASTLFQNARIYQRQGRYGLALSEYEAAYRLDAKNGRILACFAHCCALKGNYGDAIRYGEEALENGCRTAEVYNNLAYCQMNYAQQRKAPASLEEALKLAPELPAAHHTRLILMNQELRKAASREGDAACLRYLPPAYLARVRAALDKALKVCPPSAELYGDAADLCAVAGRFAPGWDDEVLTYLKNGSARGLVVVGRETDQYYARFRTDARFAALLQTPPPTVPRTPSPYLVDPLNER